jgi:alkane 1-monooxygenase
MVVHALPFLVSLTFLPIAAMGAAYGGLWVFGGIAYAFAIIPIVDHLMGVTASGIDPNTEERALLFHRVITWAWVPIQIGLIFTFIAIAGTDLRTPGEMIVIMIAVGLLTGGIGITYAHELMHQTNRFERALSEILMTSTLYGHFCIEHVYGHHIHVGTPKDPVSARYGESIYKFYPRAVLGSLLSAWRIQRDRMARRDQPVYALSNPFWRYALAYAVYVSVAYALAGWFGVGLFVLQAVVAFTLLEIINYVEHYGLRRRQLADGRYERVQPHHSWNASHRITNYFLINLQRHSDHHKHPQRRYPVLQHYHEADAPQLPFGYPTMLILSLLAPLWFWIMNPRVEDWRRRHYPEGKAA